MSSSFATRRDSSMFKRVLLRVAIKISLLRTKAYLERQNTDEGFLKSKVWFKLGHHILNGGSLKPVQALSFKLSIFHTKSRKSVNRKPERFGDEAKHHIAEMTTKHVLYLSLVFYRPSPDYFLRLFWIVPQEYLEITEKIFAAQIVVSFLYPLALHRS